MVTSLDTDVRYIKGIGEARAKSMSKLGIKTLRDLVSFFPRAYEDRTSFRALSELVPGETVCVRAIVATQPRINHIRKGLDLVKLRAVDESASINITFFNQGYVKDSLKPGDSYIFYGKIGGTIKNPEMTNPVFENENTPGRVTGRIMPVYRLTSGMSQNIMAKSVLRGLDACGDVLPDPLPKIIKRKYELAQSRFSYENIHFPSNFEALELARRRLIFEELFVLSCAMNSLRGKRVKKQGLQIAPADLDKFYSALPFLLTGAQKRAIDEAISDMRGQTPMSRLVQGDVGSGKTAVAAACCWYVAQSGYQSAFMAPTEILAEQHYQTLSKLLDPLGIKTQLLTGSLSAKKKNEATDKLKSGEIDLIIGTHALISEKVEFKSLALVVTDEQHRFGVQQRSALTAKGESPHVLVMSATPIPRTLALMIYGELDVSIIDELPPGRQKIETYSVSEKMRPRIYVFIRKLVAEGRQIYIVCPMVEENEEQDDGLKSVREYAKKMQDEVFPDMKVSLVHGKMKTKEKEAAMSSFVSGESQILVATTVIEVGVDVPNAALMVIENADRFGLSQLHQLRGRVGRGVHRSYCIMFEGEGGEISQQRLKVLCETNDGFKISEEDLKLRGPGDFFGSRQHGLPELKIADFASDMNILRSAQEAAREVLDDDPNLEKPDNESLLTHIRLMLDTNEGTFN